MQKSKIIDLKTILSRPDVWQASSFKHRPSGLPTGFNLLDQALYQKGWPRRGLTEILLAQHGVGELQLLGKSLCELSRTKWLLLINPPYIPYIPALIQQHIDPLRLIIVEARNLSELLWSTEQALKHAPGGAVISWLPAKGVSYQHLRKFQLASHSTDGLSILFRPLSCVGMHSPAALRIKLMATNTGLELNVLKQPGGWSGQKILLHPHSMIGQPQLPVAKLPIFQAHSVAPLSSRMPLSIALPPAPQVSTH